MNNYLFFIYSTEPKKVPLAQKQKEKQGKRRKAELTLLQMHFLYPLQFSLSSACNC